MPTKHINRYVFQSKKSSRTRSWTKTTQKQEAEKSQEVEIWDQKSDKTTPGRPGASCKMLLGAAEVGARSAQWSRAHPGVVRQSQTSQKVVKRWRHVKFGVFQKTGGRPNFRQVLSVKSVKRDRPRQTSDDAGQNASV